MTWDTQRYHRDFFFTAPPAIEKSLPFLKRIIVTKYLMILMTNVLSIPILCRTIDDSRIDTLWKPTITVHHNAINSDNTSPPIFSQNQAPLSTTSRRHEAPTVERTNTDFFPTLKRQFILELASKGNFPASLFLVLFTVHMEYSATHVVHNTSSLM